MTSSWPPRFDEALIAAGPTPDYPGRMHRFGQLVGSWTVTGTRLNEQTAEWVERDFVWLVEFILDGRAVQDVELVATATQPSGYETLATTTRVYDPFAGAWRVSYFAPALNEYCQLVASPYRHGMRQEGTRTDGKPIRWNFTAITATSFTWEGWVSADQGLTWHLTEHNEATRLRP